MQRKFSYSMIDTFHTCPWKFHWKYVLWNKEKSTEAMERGNRLHTEFEDVFSGRAPMTPLVEPYREAVNAIMETAPLIVQAEIQLGVRRDGSGCAYGASDVFFRSKSDFVLIPDSHETHGLAYYLDWKTGKYNPQYIKLEQLDWTAVVLRANFPSRIDAIATRLAYTTTNDFYPENEWRVLDDAGISEAWRQLQRAAGEIEYADRAKEYPKRQSGLCRFCSVGNCEFAGNA